MFDSISLSILWSRLISIVDEAGTTLQRTSFSSVTRESADFAVVLMDTKGQSVAQSSVGDIQRTDTDPQSIGGEIPYRSMIVSGILAAERGAATLGIALRRRTGTVDLTRGRVTSFDVGAILDRPAGLPIRAALSLLLVN